MIYNLFEKAKILIYCQEASFKVKLSFLKGSVWLGINRSFTKLRVLGFLKTKQSVEI